MKPECPKCGSRLNIVTEMLDVFEVILWNGDYKLQFYIEAHDRNDAEFRSKLVYPGSEIVSILYVK